MGLNAATSHVRLSGSGTCCSGRQAGTPMPPLPPATCVARPLKLCSAGADLLLVSDLRQIPEALSPVGIQSQISVIPSLHQGFAAGYVPCTCKVAFQLFVEPLDDLLWCRMRRATLCRCPSTNWSSGLRWSRSDSWCVQLLYDSCI